MKARVFETHGNAPDPITQRHGATVTEGELPKHGALVPSRLVLDEVGR